MPGTPTIVASWGRLSVRARLRRRRLGLHFLLAADEAPRCGPVARRPSRQRCRDRFPNRHRLPFPSPRLARADRTRSRTRSFGRSPRPTSEPFSGAAPCSRAAVLTTSPDEPSPASGCDQRERALHPCYRYPHLDLLSPRPNLGSPGPRVPPARGRLRSEGAPNTATTASPMNFSTVPPWLSSSARTRP